MSDRLTAGTTLLIVAVVIAAAVVLVRAEPRRGKGISVSLRVRAKAVKRLVADVADEVEDAVVVKDVHDHGEIVAADREVRGIDLVGGGLVKGEGIDRRRKQILGGEGNRVHA